MKYLISLFILTSFLTSFLTAKNSYAQQGITNVHEVATSTSSIVQSISICAVTGGNCQGACDVALATSSGTLAGYFGIEVYNQSASTNTVNCGFDVSLSTNSGSAWYGREVLAGIGVYFGALSPRKLYCMTQNSGGCTKVTVTQMK